MAARDLLRLVAYTGEGSYDDAARRSLSIVSAAMREFPQAFGEALNAVDMLVGGIVEIAVVGDPADTATTALLDTARKPYRPNTVIALAREDVAGEAAIPLLSYRTRKDDQPTVYVCRNFVCKLPVTTREALENSLQENSSQ